MGFGRLVDMTTAISDEDRKKYQEAAEACITEDDSEQVEKPKKKSKKISEKNFQNLASQMPKKPPVQKDQFSAEKPEEQTVLLSVHQEKMDALQKKIDALTDKNKALSDEKKLISKDLTTSDKNYNAEKKKRESLEKKNQDLNGKYDEVNKELKNLKKMLKENREESQDKKDEIIDKNKKTIDDLKAQIKTLNEEKDSLTKEKQQEIDRNAVLSSQIDELNVKIEGLSEELRNKETLQPAVQTPEAPTGMVISRISPTDFQSSLFTGPRYRVKFARDCSFISFKMDILGKATCKNGIISLPQLSAYLPFVKITDYTAILSDDGSYTVSFTDGGRS